MSTIKVRLKDASGNVLHPETDWSVVQNKPSIEANSSGKIDTWNPGTLAKIDSTQIRLTGSNDTYTSQISLSPTQVTIKGKTDATISAGGVTISGASEGIILESGLNTAIRCGDSNGTVKIRDKNTSGSFVDLNSYPINWSALAHKPDFRYKLCFGAKRVTVQDLDSHEDTTTFYPAVRVCEITDESDGTSTTSYSKCYYFDAGSWKSFSNSEFVVLEF